MSSAYEVCTSQHGSELSVELLQCVSDAAEYVSTAKFDSSSSDRYSSSNWCLWCCIWLLSSIMQIKCKLIMWCNRSKGRNDISSGLNSFFLIYAGALVFFMQVGFAMLCAGSIREKNVKNVLLWNLLDSAGGAFGFWWGQYNLLEKVNWAFTHSLSIQCYPAGPLGMPLLTEAKMHRRERLSLEMRVFSWPATLTWSFGES